MPEIVTISCRTAANLDKGWLVVAESIAGAGAVELLVDSVAIYLVDVTLDAHH